VKERGLLEEEAGCQACEKLSPGERVCWGSDFSWREPNSSYSALRIPVQPVVEALEGKWTADGLLREKVAHFLGWDMHVGNERL
jgi:hypothetical protein